MSFGSDVKAKTITASGDAVNGRTRIQGIYYTCDSTASSFSLKTGGSGGATVLQVYTPASPVGQDLIIPDDGILATDGVYVAFADAHVTSVTVLYVGGAPA